MTDRNALILLLEEFGIVWTTPDWNANAIIIEARMGPRQKGYTGFQTEFEFHEDGRFKEVGIWE